MYSTQMLLVNHAEDMPSDDEIDELFSKLLQIEPPATLVDDILATVAGLPLPQEMNWDVMTGVIVHNGMRMPS